MRTCSSRSPTPMEHRYSYRRQRERRSLPAQRPEIIGRWDDAETLVLLWRESSTNRIKLTVTSIATDRAMQAAIADSLRLEASEAPARDLARRATEEAALRARDEKVRSDNKVTFNAVTAASLCSRVSRRRLS